ncbi:MAG: NUDIX domain-containing protein [Ruminococcus sp.]|nr:NUDIX domain-containing protein [Ruminococcus sp.]
MEVKFYDKVNDDLLKFAVIISTYNGKLVFCKHRQRDTLEIPGGHREPGELIGETARRELYEETGAVDFKIEPICVYSVTAEDNFDGQETFGMLFRADIFSFENELHSEIESICLLDGLPEKWTYPLIQPKLIEEAVRRGVVTY